MYIFEGICVSRPPALALAPVATSVLTLGLDPGPQAQFVFDGTSPILYLTAPVPICIYWYNKRFSYMLFLFVL